MSNQIKAKQRVADHGEVFTNPREVNAMLDLVKQETERIDSRFLEPACGTGNFLVEILRRKLAVVRARHGKNLPEYEKNCFVAISSIYGVDLLTDNVQECRDRLFEIIEDAYKKQSKQNYNPKFMEAIHFLLNKNILCGDVLTLKDRNNDPIIFCEWSVAIGNKVKRRDFRLDEMLEGSETDSMKLFGASGGSALEWEYDEETQSYIPSPIKEYPLVDFYEVGNYE